MELFQDGRQMDAGSEVRSFVFDGRQWFDSSHWLIMSTCSVILYVCVCFDDRKWFFVFGCILSPYPEYWVEYSGKTDGGGTRQESKEVFFEFKPKQKKVLINQPAKKNERSWRDSDWRDHSFLRPLIPKSLSAQKSTSSSSQQRSTTISCMLYISSEACFSKMKNRSLNTCSCWPHNTCFRQEGWFVHPCDIWVME